MLINEKVTILKSNEEIIDSFKVSESDYLSSLYYYTKNDSDFAYFCDVGDKYANIRAYQQVASSQKISPELTEFYMISAKNGKTEKNIRDDAKKFPEQFSKSLKDIKMRQHAVVLAFNQLISKSK